MIPTRGQQLGAETGTTAPSVSDQAPIGRHQVQDYARRLRTGITATERRLSPNLAYDPDARATAGR